MTIERAPSIGAQLPLAGVPTPEPSAIKIPDKRVVSALGLGSIAGYTAFCVAGGLVTGGVLPAVVGVASAVGAGTLGALYPKAGLAITAGIAAAAALTFGIVMGAHPGDGWVGVIVGPTVGGILGGYLYGRPG